MQHATPPARGCAGSQAAGWWLRPAVLHEHDGCCWVPLADVCGKAKGSRTGLQLSLHMYCNKARSAVLCGFDSPVSPLPSFALWPGPCLALGLRKDRAGG